MNRHRPAPVLRTLLAAGLLAAPGALLAEFPGPALTHFPSRNLGFQDGLTSTTVEALLEGPGGVLYAGTEGGLFRFDGHKFEAVPLPADYRDITTLMAAQDGLWVGSRGGLGLLRNDGEFLREDFPAGIIQRLDRDQSGRVWVLARNVASLAPDGRSFRTVPAPPGDGAISSLFASQDGDTVLAVSGNRLWSGSSLGNAWREEPLPPGLAALAAGRDRLGWVWVRGRDQLYRRDPAGLRWEAVPGAMGGSIPDGFRFTESREGWLWIPSDRGLYLCRGRDCRLVSSAEQGNPPVLGLNTREGATWLAGLGVNQLLGRSLWRVADTSDGLPDNVVWSTLDDAQGRVWAATDRGLALGTA